MYASDFRRIARENLSGRWLISALVCFVASLLGGLSSGGSVDISKKNIDKLIDLRSYYRITGRHPGYKVFNPDDELLHKK